ncbi:hypothetical protein AGMMS50256_17880 [Betaproteobacteria bacterium]|nr:hypothetical protein AGMMS50256_17880 [Betaproteobacteria bacterium]
MAMSRDKIARLLVEALQVTNHRDFVIIGSLSVLGVNETPPESMTLSLDVDLYPKNDPGRASEVSRTLGEGSEFEQEHGYYADAVSPMLPSLPNTWEERLVKIDFESGVTAWFLDPNDAAISKYARSGSRDREWIRAGLQAGIFSLPTIEYRLHETFLETEELQKARTAIAEDKAWLAALRVADF